MAGVRPKRKTVEDIKSTILTPSLVPYFEVQIPVPTFMSQLIGARDPYNYLTLLCTEASLPGNQLITFNVDNDYTGVTEQMPHRKVYDQKLDLTFYVNADENAYYPIKFFETYISFIAGEDQKSGQFELKDSNYFYRLSYPDDYMLDGLYIYKFEKNRTTGLTYQFIRTYPTNINTMPITYGDAQVLKCTVSYSYIRYILNQKFDTSRKVVANEPAPAPILPEVLSEEIVPNFDKRILTGSANDNDDNTVRGELSNRTQGFINGIRVPRI